MQLRDYQQQIVAGIHRRWSEGARNVLAVLPTGGGKTVVFGDILRTCRTPSIAIAHRRELVGQMSVTLGRLGIRHRIIAPPGTVRQIVDLQVAVLGRSWLDPNAMCGVAGVDTLTRRDLTGWGERIALWVCDEGHHLLRGNKWGKALDLFPAARGLSVTATPVRADGRGLGRHADGMIDSMVVGPGLRDLIGQGYLSDYRIFAPKSDFDVSSVPVSPTTGEFSPTALREAAGKSHITGDMVESYLRIARGKLGVTFCVSVELADETAARYRAAGVPAESVSAGTPDLIRAEILRRFARRDLLQLVNVDLFGEGFDLPALEVVSMGRPTESFPLFAQQFGRGLRALDGKDSAIIIDHVGNVMRHGLPDALRDYSLDRRERRSRSSDSPPTIRVCAECTGVYERFLRACPYCGCCPVPLVRSGPEHVDGDLLELDGATLARLRGEITRIDAPPRFPVGSTPAIRGAIMRSHGERQQAQHALRESIAWWAGWQQSLGRDTGEGYRRFYHEFKIDVASAQALNARDAAELHTRVEATLERYRSVA